MTRHVHIDRLDLDLRGLDPALAEAAVRALGPALQRQLAQAGSRPPAQSAPRIDAGHVPAGGDAQALADRLAQRIAASTTPGPKD
jgi:hypothetical protein